jgi:hypothetical protein
MSVNLKPTTIQIFQTNLACPFEQTKFGQGHCAKQIGNKTFQKDLEKNSAMFTNFNGERFQFTLNILNEPDTIIIDYINTEMKHKKQYRRKPQQNKITN